jgi:GABA(A) receptor-associated protein
MSNTSNAEFVKQYSLEQRKSEATRIRQKYPDRIPVICEPKDLEEHKNFPKKYLVPSDLTIGQFIYVLRKRVKITDENAIFLFINGRVPPSGNLVSFLYESDKNEDGFLYIKFSNENVFGGRIE